jgi:thioredoxin 1
MASKHLLDLTDANIDETLSGDLPVLVDFTAVWCGPCKAIAPTVAKLADEFSGRVAVGKLDIDHNPKTPAKYHVRAVPTLIIFKGGKAVNKVVGAVNEKKMRAMIDAVL